tara:strand:+ start:273 stop:908 length:636 start_codon:yes stop_codon:yes gene_type:complete
MRKININNTLLTDILKEVEDKIISKEGIWNFDAFEKTDYYVEPEYLKDIQTRGHSGLPQEEVDRNLQRGEISKNQLPNISKKEYFHLLQDQRKIIHNLESLLGIKDITSFTVYPPGGYIGWHSNYDVPGYNCLFTWSEFGDGFFKFIDPLTKETVTLEDSSGWNARMGYFGSGDQEMWHCAYTNCRRLTIAMRFDDVVKQDLAKRTISGIM